jgi:hypothetical protein
VTTGGWKPGCVSCGLKRPRSAAVIAAGNAFVQDIRRGHYKLGLDVPVVQRVAEAFTEPSLGVRSGHARCSRPRSWLVLDLGDGRRLGHLTILSDPHMPGQRYHRPYVPKPTAGVRTSRHDRLDASASTTDLPTVSAAHRPAGAASVGENGTANRALLVLAPHAWEWPA